MAHCNGLPTRSVVKRNSFFAHPENIIIGMPADSNSSTRQLAVDKILKFRSHNHQDSNPSTENKVRKFVVKELNLQARHFYEMTDIMCDEVEEPPLTRSYTEDEILSFKTSPLQLHHPCHNQAVERHIKLVSKASSTVATFERRDGLIRQQIRSRKLMKKFDSEKDFHIPATE